MSVHSTAHTQHGSPEVRAKVAARLRSIEGHVRGIARMVEEGAYCIDLMKQTLAVQRAVDKVNALLLEDHLEHCVATAISAADPAERRRTVTELLEVLSVSGKL